MTDSTRRTFVKGVGATAAASAFAGQATAGVDSAVVDDQFDRSGGLQEALVVFGDSDAPNRLDGLDLAKGYRVFDQLDIAWTFLTPDQLETVAGWDSVLRVKKAEELEYLNDDVSRESMHVDPVHGHTASEEETSGDEDTEPALADTYLGEDVHVVVIDSGLDGSHPAFAGRVEANYRYVDRPLGARDPLWVDVGETPNDEVGHGTHCTGIALGDGSGATGGDYHGMAPKATVTAYNTTQAVYLPYAVAAWNHMLGRARDPTDDFDPDVVTNSYGVARGTEYNPFDPLNVATWRAYEEGMFVAFAMGNDGPTLGTGNRYGKAPHVMPVAASEKTIDTEDTTNNRAITGFSSRGRKLDAAKAADQPSKYIASEVFYDREELLGNLEEYWALADGSTRPVSSDDRTGTVGAGVNSSPGAAAVDEDTGSTYESFTAKGNADVVTLDYSFSPEGQWIRVLVYEQQDDGEYRQVAAAREEPTKIHDDLTFDVTGSTAYLVEFRPEDAATAEYELTIEQSARPDGDLADDRPVSLYRPGIATHGNSVMSTVQPGSVLGPVGLAPTEPLYGRLSGTSMATPGCAGIAALCIEAYRSVHPDDADPDPIDVIRILESTARDFNSNYNAHNAGAGFVDTAAAVKVAEDLAGDRISLEDLDTGLDALVEPVGEDVTAPPVDLSVTGTRSDDGSLFTGGQTNTVQLTVDSIDTSAVSSVSVTDVVPAGWEVLTEFHDDLEDDNVSSNGDGTKSVDFGGGFTEGDTISYMVEAPSGAAATGTYTFGPATATTDADIDGSKETTFGGTDDNLVVGPST